MAKSPVYGLKSAVETAQTTADSKSTVEEETAWYSRSTQRGSAATAIPYFSTQQYDTTGTIGVVVNDTTNGFNFTATVACKVVASFTFVYSVASQELGFSLNASSLSAGIHTLVLGEVLGMTRSNESGNYTATVSVTVDMQPGDILRPHGTGGSMQVSDYTAINLIAQKVS